MTFDAEAVFAEEFARAFENERDSTVYDPDEWLRAGYGKYGQGRDWWEANGAQLAQNFIDWFNDSPDVEIWVTPDGVPAIELEFSEDFDGVQVRGYIDLILKMGQNLVITDYKSGTAKPKTVRQLATYAAAVEKKYGIRPQYGAWFMCRGGKKGDEFFIPFLLNQPRDSAQYLGSWFRNAKTIIEAGAFPSNPGDICRQCSVHDYCTAFNGKFAADHDPDHPGYVKED